MRDRLQVRLGELRKEFATGQTHLHELEKQQMYLRETILRISGAIQILEELLAEVPPGEQNGTRSSETQHVSDQAHPINVTDVVSNLEEHDHGPGQDSMAGNRLVGKE